MKDQQADLFIESINLFKVNDDNLSKLINQNQTNIKSFSKYNEFIQELLIQQYRQRTNCQADQSTKKNHNHLAMKLSKEQVKKRIQTQTLNGQTIHYSYAQKAQATLSMFKNDRLLMFNFNTGLLYYINEPKDLPFKTEFPKPKNEAANMNVSIAKNPAGTTELQIQFIMKNQKNQNVSVEWIFTMENKNLAQDWLRVIQNFKNKKIQEMMDAEDKKKKVQQEPIKEPKQDEKVNHSWIHDTLGFGLMEVSRKHQPKIEIKPQPMPELKSEPLIMSPQKQKKPQDLKKSVANQGSSKSIEQSPLKREATTKPIENSVIRATKPAQQPSKPNNQPFQPNLLNSLKAQQQQSQQPGSNTKLTESKFQKQPQKPSLRESVINIRQSNPNIRESNISKNPSNSNINVNPPQNNTLKPPIESSPSVHQSRKQQPTTPTNKITIPQVTDPRQSKLTLRDELESILQRSHMRQSNFENSFVTENEQSRISTNTKYNPETDWNLKFLKKQNEIVLLEFQQFALKEFMSVLKEDESSRDRVRVYLKSELMILVADARTIEAKKLKGEFRNYHFIMQACKDNFIVGVPLACLIQHQGTVALVQSLIPEDAPKIDLTHEVLIELKDLQRYTRIKNSILKRAALYDLTELYQSKDKRLIYINQLVEYLPVHIEENYRGGFLRPQHLLDNVNQFMQGGMAHEANRQDIKTLQDALKSIEQNIKILAKQLSTQDLVFANGIELKNIMHQRGINLKHLPMLYSQVTHKITKKYIHTFMVAKVCKDYILEKLSQAKQKQSRILYKQTVESLFILLIEGSSSHSDELWKEITLKFRKEYNSAMSNHDIVGSFFLNSMMKLIPGKYDLTKLNDQKVFFKDDSILAKGFISQLLPKIKTYHRFTTQLTDKIIYTCRQQRLQQNFTAIVEELKLTSQPIPSVLSLSRTDQQLKQYMTEFSCPSEFDSKSFAHLKIFESVGLQPPSTLSISTTKSYLKWGLEKDQLSRFKEVIQDSLRIIDYWFDPSHIYHCQFLQLLSDYCEATGTIDESIKLIKESLAMCIKNGAGINKKTGYKYYALAEKELRAGRKNDSLENFTKAKNIMQSFNDQTIKYPITLIKLSSLYLNNNDFQNCIIYSKNAVQKFDEIQTSKTSPVPKGSYDRYSIKAIEIMTRAYEIENKKSELYRVAQLCSVKYNKTQNPQTFEQLVKICLTAVIFKHTVEKCAVFQSLIEKMASIGDDGVSADRCLNELMVSAEQFNVMEKFMFKFESLERIVADINGRRTLQNDSKDFINIVKNVVGVVGEDYVFGLIKQKEFQ